MFQEGVLLKGAWNTTIGYDNFIVQIIFHLAGTDSFDAYTLYAAEVDRYTGEITVTHADDPAGLKLADLQTGQDPGGEWFS